jgi:hypothetical protein
MTAWTDYVAATGQLDTVRQDAAAAVATQERSVAAARTELAGVRQRALLQRSRLTDLAGRYANLVPVVDPLPDDRAVAAGLLPSPVADPTPGVSAALKAAWATLDAADVTLSAVADGGSRAGLLPDWPPAARNAIPYLWYSMLAIIALIIINAFAGNSPNAGVVALFFDFTVPVGAFVLGLVSVGLVFGPGPDGRKRRGAGIGALICCVPLLIGVMLSVF